MNLASMRALVTGGGGGIGGAIADELLKRGASVLLVDRDAVALARAAARLAVYGERAGTLTADLTSSADRQRLCAAAAAWRGGVNVLINNAGVNHLAGILARFTEAEDREAVIRCARGIYWLYGQVFRGLDAEVESGSAALTLRRTA